MNDNAHTPIEALALAVLEALNGRRSDESTASVEYHATHGNYYALLGVERGSRSEDIVQTLERLREQNPPFHVQAALDNAESILLDPELRARYNATLA